MEDKQKRFEQAIDRIILKAMDEGKFDNLPGKGKPLPDESYPFEDSDMSLAYRLLKDNDFAPEWIEERKQVESEADAAHAALERTGKWCQGQADHALAEDEWQRALKTFREKATALNRRIRDSNLKSPLEFVQMPMIDAENEIAGLTNGS